jgi:hypothetical protein
MKKILTLFSICLLLFSCGPDKSTPEYAAKKYLTALKNKDWETAMKYATPATREQIDMMKALGTDFGITEIKDIRCDVKGSRAMCYFCCSKDSSFNKVLLVLNDQNQWVANSSKGSWLEYHYWDQMK